MGGSNSKKGNLSDGSFNIFTQEDSRYVTNSPMIMQQHRYSSQANLNIANRNSRIELSNILQPTKVGQIDLTTLGEQHDMENQYTGQLAMRQSQLDDKGA